MAKEICISTTPHETRLAILENDELAEIYYERENEYTLAGSIYKGKVTRVLPGMQSAFVDVGLERDAFLYVTDFLEEQEDGADFESAGGQRPRRENGHDSAQPREPRGRQPQPEAKTEPASEPAAETPSEESDSPGGPRRWRGRRGRRRGFRPRGQQEEAQPVERSTDEPETGNVASTTDEAFEETPEPVREYRAPSPVQTQTSAPAILLPGESLSRYGRAAGADARPAETAAIQPAQARSNYTASKPSTLIESPITWDGGALLPGESLSRYRGPEKANTAVVEQAAEPWTTPEIAVESHASETGSVEAAAEHAEIDHAPIVSTLLVDEIPHELPETNAPVAITGIVHEPEIAARIETAIAAETLPESAEAATAESASVAISVAHPSFESEEDEIREEVHEFEPESASASHRIDPAPPSEFRVPSVVEDDIVEEADLPLIAQEVREDGPIEAHATEYAVDYQEIETNAPEAESSEQPFGFAPGSGLLEEEVIDEEEYDFEPIDARAAGAHGDEHDSEDLEEETLDHAGPELGEMVREAHLNQRLSTSTELEEDEDEDLELGHVDVDGDAGDDEEHEEEDESLSAGQSAGPAPLPRDGDRGRDRKGGRRGDRRGDRRGYPGGRRQGGGRRPSAQTMDLPIISDLLKQGQEILVQIAKEPIAKKGARITSHIALPGRFLVFMPTVNHVGVSRKISSDEERQRLKRILISEKGDAPGGFIVRTAADGASEDELRADLRFLISLWSEIKQREESSKAPALIYHDLNLVERVLRDQVSDNFSAIWVDSESEYERIVRFLNRFQPSLVRRVKLYTKETPLFEQFGIQEEITKALKSKVWLKSGGSIVINQTEALVAIDINTGKYVGKTARLEDTILKTNLDAIPEIVRQIRLRDLGGIIVIDFIDMDERKNRHKVMQALEEALKVDRAPSKVLQFNDFGLVAITRKRVKQSLERTLSIPCPVCTGTGMVKGPTTVANEIYVELRKMQRHIEGRDVMLRVNPEVVKTLKANNARWLNELEEMLGKTIIVKSDATLHPEQFDIH
jgi:Rne/Rng family ribonuclease